MWELKGDGPLGAGRGATPAAPTAATLCWRPNPGAAERALLVHGRRAGVVGPPAQGRALTR